MALKERISDDDIALLECIEDPVYFAELMRNTADGDPNPTRWKSQTFSLRHYQREIMTDKSEYISICAGRAVGKTFAPSYSNV